jgi:cytochrome c
MPGANTMKRLASLTLIAFIASPAIASDGPEALLEQARCGMCHQIDSPMLGPSYRAIAERYRGQDGAAEEIFVRLREGSQGVWGQAPMPPVAEAVMSDDDLRSVIDWTLSR